MKKFITLFLLILSIKASYGQNLIGFNYEAIRKFMNENRKDLSYSKVTNSRFNYIKYVDDTNNQTVLFFLDKDSICKSIRIICDENSKKQRIKEFNSIYTPKGENKWIDNKKGTRYLIELKDEEWASVITMLPAK